MTDIFAKCIALFDRPVPERAFRLALMMGTRQPCIMDYNASCNSTYTYLDIANPRVRSSASPFSLPRSRNLFVQFQNIRHGPDRRDCELVDLLMTLGIVILDMLEFGRLAKGR